MTKPTLAAQCASFFSQQPRWSKPANASLDDWPADSDVQVFLANEREGIFLSPLLQEAGVRLFRCAAPDPIAALNDQLWTVRPDGDTGWVWLQDEWAMEHASVMHHPATGTIAWVRDLAEADSSTEDGKWQSEIEAWIAEADSLMEQIGWTQSA